MLVSIVHYFWPDLNDDEIKKYTILSTIFFLIMGSSWLMRSLKNIIFLKIAFPQALGCALHHGILMQPAAKFWTPFITIPLILLYSKMVDWYKKDTLYYIIIITYTIVFTGISILLAMHHFWGDAFLGKQLLSHMGWITFFSVETYYSLIIALLWSFTSSICTTASAQKGYPVIIVMAQIACLVVSLPLLGIDYCGGIWTLFLCATVASFSTIFLMQYFLRVIPASQLAGDVPYLANTANHPKTQENFIWGFFSGLYLLCTRPYLLGILVISGCYEIITQIIEYQTLSSAVRHTSFASPTGFAQFQGIFGIAIHSVSLLIALLGSQYFIKRYSLQDCLLIIPLALFIILTSYLIFCVTCSPTGEHTLWITIGILMLINGLGCAINYPIKEIMYIPTSTDIKFKSKSWIDIFGVRAAKQGSAQMNNVFNYDLSQLILLGTMCSIGLTILWILAAWQVGNKNKKLLKTQTIIE